jgi:hypothetical protein
MAINIEAFKRAYELSHGKSDNVIQAVQMYHLGEDYTKLSDGVQIIDAYSLLVNYIFTQYEQSKSNSG